MQWVQVAAEETLELLQVPEQEGWFLQLAVVAGPL